MAYERSTVVPLRELPTDREIGLANTFVRDTLQGLPMRAALERPDDDPDAGSAQARVHLYSEDDNVFVRGHLAGWFAVACSRCVNTVKVPLDETLAITYLPKAKLPASTDDVHDVESGVVDENVGFELTEDDLDLYGYEGEEIDLAPMFREHLILAVPFAPLCREDCKGLCPQCGIDRNCESCSCQPPGDARWAALKNLKI